MELKTLLARMVEVRASDLHLRSDRPAVFRVDGHLVPATSEPVPAADVDRIIDGILSPRQKREFEERHECDLSIGVEGIGRFRVNVFCQRGAAQVAFRIIPEAVPSFRELKLPPAIQKLSEETRGLVVATGTTGSGKSTTLAAMIDYINSTRDAHIVTIEDPIEFLHRDKKSILAQRELGQDTLSYTEALKHVVRQDPDVILLGEMRDLDTISAALTAAQTGHLVLSTLHTIDAPQTVNRIIDIFPPHQQNQIRYMLGDTLKGVISQRLLRHASGQGRVPAVEILIVTGIIRKYIHDNNLGEIVNMMRQGQYYGMQTFHQALVSLIKAGEITLEEALAAAPNPEEIMMAVRGVATGTESASYFPQP